MAIVIGERDRWLLDALAKCRFLTTSQLRSLAFGTRSAANKRLRKLLDGGLIRVWVRDLAKENVYSLDRAGARLLAGENPLVASVPRWLDGNLDHLLAINEMRIALALAAPKFGAALSLWRSDWELRTDRSLRVVPDAFFLMQFDDDARACVLEVDHASRSPRGVLWKLLRYTGFRSGDRGLYGYTDFVVLVVGSSSRSLGHYRRAVLHAGLGQEVWFASLAEIRNHGVTAPIWMAAFDDEAYSLRDVLSLPNGKEGFVGHGAENAGA